MKHIFEEIPGTITEKSLCEGITRQKGVIRNSLLEDEKDCNQCQQIDKHGKSTLPKVVEKNEYTSEFDVRLIFVRDLGKLHYSKKELKLDDFLSIPSPVKDLSRDQLLIHLAGLEKSIRLLKSYLQGHMSAYGEEIEPELAEKRKKDDVKKDSHKKEPVSLEGMLSKVGMSKEQFVAELIKRARAKSEEK